MAPNTRDGYLVSLLVSRRISEGIEQNLGEGLKLQMGSVERVFWRKGGFEKMTATDRVVERWKERAGEDLDGCREGSALLTKKVLFCD